MHHRNCSFYFFQQLSDELFTSCLQPSLERRVEDDNKSNFTINASNTANSNLPSVADQQDLFSGKPPGWKPLMAKYLYHQKDEELRQTTFQEMYR